MRQINLRVPEELLARIDVAAGDVPRERWLRRAVEQALSGVETNAGVEPRAPLGGVPGVAELPAPAEQPYRSSSFAKRDVRPVPKRGG